MKESEMALIVRWRYSCVCVFFLVFLGQAAALSYPGNDYDLYDMVPQAIEARPFDTIQIVRLKRNVLTSTMPSEALLPNLTNSHLAQSPDIGHPDHEVIKDLHLPPINNTAKTGGNYHSHNDTLVSSEVEQKTNVSSTVFHGEKWLATIDKLNKTATEMASRLPHPTDTSATSTVPSIISQSAERTNETSKIDGKTPKKAESVTKPPKLDPTKPSVTEDKSTKKPAGEEVEKAVLVPKTVTTSSTTEQPDEDMAVSFPQDVSNKTLQQHNITNTEEDHHQYYNSSFVINEDFGLSYWVDMTNRSDVQVNELLSQSHRRAATITLKFDFPFYGHLVRNVTIATGGFLYTGDYVHSWLAATQYIAPLMANFDTSISNHSFVKYVDNGTALTVQWEKVVLQDKPTSGDFTFQATLHSNGDIVFVYRNIPVVIENIQDDYHPVKVGLSDAYIIDRTIFFVRRKTIYEYHRVNFHQQDLKNWTVIYLNALPTCLDAKSCSECVSRSTSFQCHWCSGSKRCSNGMDRFRQEWLVKGCDRTSFSNLSQCWGTAVPSKPVDQSTAFSDKHSLSQQEGSNSSMGMSGIIGILFITAFIAGLGVWVFYAYRNPHTASGQLLIRYRPSTWRWRRGEARYTAATIHM